MIQELSHAGHPPTITDLRRTGVPNQSVVELFAQTLADHDFDIDPSPYLRSECGSEPDAMIHVRINGRAWDLHWNTVEQAIPMAIRLSIGQPHALLVAANAFLLEACIICGRVKALCARTAA